ncbi:ABC transporter substrate-binding protein [Leptothrix discophora]|uniref:Extracellular solute-binding protein n=1 Tax=Leptothrix discophora TaxID=89 RepID=A0ABT9G303_LEPDI|nr:extracellular solute-binding protein [Leptothrix discophora]MDP4300868.1 extracellular solute-binding protein [Leptothrix discophora]
MSRTDRSNAASMPRRLVLARLPLLGLMSLLATGAMPALAQTQTLTVAAFPALDEIVKAAIPVWKQKHPNVEIKVVSRQFSDHHTAMTTALSTSSNLPDVMALEFGFVGRFAEGGGLEDLSRAPYNIGASKGRFVSYAYQQATADNGAVVAAPADLGPGTLLYRSDLLQKAGLTEADLTRSWDSYIASGVKLKAATGAYLLAHARDIKDIAIRANVKAGEGLYFDDKGNILVESPRFVRAFELAKSVRDQKLDGKIGAWSNEWSEGFKRGTIGTQMMGAWLAGHLSNWLAPNTKGQWRAAQLPEGAWASYGGSFYALPKGASAANKALAWEFVQMMTLNPAIQQAAFKSQDAFPALVETHKDAFFDQPIEFLGGQKARVIWREATTRINALDVNKFDPIAEEIVNTEMDKVLDQGKDIKAALADARKLLERRARR